MGVFGGDPLFHINTAKAATRQQQACSAAAPSSEAVASHVLLDPVLSLIGAEHRFQAALLACPQLLAVGHGTGDLTLLDFSRHSTLVAVRV